MLLVLSKLLNLNLYIFLNWVLSTKDGTAPLSLSDRRDDFTFGVNYVMDRFPAPMYFNLDVNISVFETNIRVLGGKSGGEMHAGDVITHSHSCALVGLLSAHVLASNKTIGVYKGSLACHVCIWSLCLYIYVRVTLVSCAAYLSSTASHIAYQQATTAADCFHCVLI